MKKTIYFIILITLFCTGTVSAQLYQYVDENGNVNFTDDLGQVPQDQREQYLQPEEEPHTDNPATDESDSAGDGSTAVEDTPEETTATSNWPDSI